MKTIVKTAWERLLVSFMLVAATVLESKSHRSLPSTLTIFVSLPP